MTIPKFFTFRLRSIILTAAVAVLAAGMQCTQAIAATVYTTDQWNTALDSVINADDTQSVALPDGRILWVFGDTISVNGVSTVSGYGYPHDAFVTQAPGTLNFTAQPGQYGYGWQQVPNWSDGTYFWMSTPVVDKGVLYVLGSRISGAANFSVVGQYVAVFNASTLAFQRFVQLPGGTTGWGGIAKTSTGWWVSGSHPVPCSYATDCKVGDFAYVPFGGLASPSKWQIHDNIIPATANIGSTLGLVKTTSGWDLFTKTGDAYGGTTIQRMQATSVTGNWTINGTWDAPAPSGAVSYGVAVHPEQSAPDGQILVSYNVNDFSSTCMPLFEYLPE